MWTKGGQEGRSCIDVETLKIQKSGISQGPVVCICTGNTSSPGDGGLCGKERRKEPALSEYLLSAGCPHYHNPAKEVLSAPSKRD